MVYSNLYRWDPLRDFLGGNHPPEAVDLVEKNVRQTVKRFQLYPAVNQKKKDLEIHGCFLFGQTFAFMMGFPKFAIAVLNYWRA